MIHRDTPFPIACQIWSLQVKRYARLRKGDPKYLQPVGYTWDDGRGWQKHAPLTHGLLYMPNLDGVGQKGYEHTQKLDHSVLPNAYQDRSRSSTVTPFDRVHLLVIHIDGLSCTVSEKVAKFVEKCQIFLPHNWLSVPVHESVISEFSSAVWVQKLEWCRY